MKRTLSYWLQPSSRKRLRQVWKKFHALLDQPTITPALRKQIESLRNQMPEGGVSWPFWREVL